MTIYEIVATVIAGLALIQPWVIALCKMIFLKIKVSFLPSAKIKLFYNRSGSYLNMGGVIESKNQSSIIKNICAKVIRQKDKAELKLNWSSFISPVNQTIGNNYVTSNENARPFKIAANELLPVFVEFANDDDKANNRLFEIYNEIALECNRIIKKNINFEQAVSELSNLAKYKKFRQELLEDFYWKESDYVIELVITYNEKCRVVYKYKFNISKQESTSLKENIDKALQSELNRLYAMPYNFACPQKEYSEIE